MAESATLKTGQWCRSMKSTTLPDAPGPRTSRSVRFPSAPPVIAPSPKAIALDVNRRDAATMTVTTTTVAVRKSHGWLPNRLNAPPAFSVYRRSRTLGIRTIGVR
jgi:hypothetical protein